MKDALLNKSKATHVLTASALLMAFVLSEDVFAQRATINGRIADSSGAVVVGAAVTVTSAHTAVTKNN